MVLRSVKKQLKPRSVQVRKYKYSSTRQKEHANRRRIQAITKNIKLIFEKHRKKTRGKKKASLQTLLEKYKGKEDVLYKKVCEKYKVDPNPELLPRRKALNPTSRKRGVTNAWISRRETLEEVLLLHQHWLECRLKITLGNPTLAIKVTEIILGFSGTDRTDLVETFDAHSSLFLHAPTEEELNEIWFRVIPKDADPNGGINENHFLALVKDLVILSRDHALAQISRQRKAVQIWNRQNSEASEHRDGSTTPRGKSSTWGEERSDDARFSEIWEAESTASVDGLSASDAKSRHSSSSSLQFSYFSLEEEEEMYERQLAAANKSRASSIKSVGEVSKNAPAVGTNLLASQVGQIAVRCNRLLGALMTDRGKFLERITVECETITRANFYAVLKRVLPELSQELEVLQKHVPRRRASQGEGLKWMPPVKDLEWGDTPVTVRFEVSESFKKDIESQKLLSFQSPVLYDLPAPPMRQLSLLELGGGDASPPAMLLHSLPFPDSYRDSGAPRRSAGDAVQFLHCEVAPFPADLAHEAGCASDFNALPPIPGEQEQSMSPVVENLPPIPSPPMHADSPERCEPLNEVIVEITALLQRYLTTIQAMEQAIILSQLILDFVGNDVRVKIDTQAPCANFEPFTLRVKKDSNVRQIVEFTYRLYPGLEQCQKQIELVLVRDQKMKTLDIESRLYIEVGDEIILTETFNTDI